MGFRGLFEGENYLYLYTNILSLHVKPAKRIVTSLLLLCAVVVLIFN